MKQVAKPEDVPNGEHYALIEFAKVTEDSGWGSENNCQVLAPNYYVTEDVDDWTNHIKALEAKKRPYDFVPYVAFIVKSKATVKTTIVVE